MNFNDNRTIGIGLVALGVLFLAGRIFGGSLMGLLWPLWIIGPGATLLYFAFRGEVANPGMAIPGAVVTGTGVILATFNTFGGWESWAYVWALYPAFVGAALYATGTRNADREMTKGGRILLQIGLMLFAGFALFFELLIFGGGAGLIDGGFVAVALIGGGLYLVLSQRTRISKGKRKVDVV